MMPNSFNRVIEYKGVLWILLALVCFLYLIETIIGGAGIIRWHGFSFKMFLFGILMFFSMIYLIVKRRGIFFWVWGLLLFLSATILLSVMIGLASDASKEAVFNDVSPLLAFYLLIPFSIVLDSYSSYKNSAFLIKVFSLLMAVIFICILMFINFSGSFGRELSSFLYHWSKTEFYFKLDRATFFYKSFIYFAIAIMFFVYQKSGFSRFATLLLFAVCFLCRSRGMVVATLLALTVNHFFINGLRISKKALFTLPVLLAISLFFLHKLFMASGVFDSDSKRWAELYQVMHETNMWSLFFGHGFGIGTADFPKHMEVSYLEIFHKQGLMGLAFYGYVFMKIMHSSSVLANKHEKSMLYFSFAGASLVIFFESFFNPFVNNPIGIPILLITLCIANFDRSRLLNTVN